jgi:glyoxylase-like metal-dependent hydrolase (beta-lactamase superfamily II)
MKTKLLRKVRKNNVIYVRNKEYRYINHQKTYGGCWYIDTGWTTDYQQCLFQRREQILEEARNMFKPVKKIL